MTSGGGNENEPMKNVLCNSHSDESLSLPGRKLTVVEPPTRVGLRLYVLVQLFVRCDILNDLTIKAAILLKFMRISP
jgi:hypothetical protein